ncbi:hypothetical protein [Bacillus testis]|uniref:hypothetical protein n=1 Tax=Bacillus testis TaxID=1622072 RepID=UPI000AFEF8B9|nr:hypothetical protein [Bacillus testis]
MNEYQKILEQEYALVDIPKGILWTTKELATTIFSVIPIPAYTNKDLIYMTPDIESWQQIFIKQLEGKNFLMYKDFMKAVQRKKCLLY